MGGIWADMRAARVRSKRAVESAKMVWDAEGKLERGMVGSLIDGAAERHRRNWNARMCRSDQGRALEAALL
jgi:hypothetical protein